MAEQKNTKTFKSMNRRELFKLAPVLALGAFATPKLREPLRKDSQDPFRILAILKAENEVIGVPNFGGLAAQARLDLVLEPLVEHVVQVDVGQQRADDLPCPVPVSVTRSRPFSITPT